MRKMRLTPLSIGPAPEDWHASFLGDLCSTVNNGFVGKSLPHQVESDDGVLYLQGFNVRPNRIDLNDCARVSRAFAKKQTKARLEKGDLLTVQSGHIGTTAVVPSSLTGASCHALIISRPIPEKVDSAFLAYYMNSPIGQRRMLGLHVGSTIKHINTSELAKYRIPLPPLPEQHKIAEILSTWDDAIEQTGALIESKRQQKKALMQQLLSGHRRLPGFDGEWQPQRIGRLFRTVSRPLEWDDEKTYCLLSVRRRSGGVFLRERLKGSAILTKTMFLAHAGDFLISKMQVLHGATGLVPPELDSCHISGSYIVLQPRGGVQIDRDFFARLSATPEFYHLTFKSSYGVHIEKMTFNVNWFLNSEVVMPPTLSEQRAIAAVLDTADKEITSLVSKLEALRQQKKGLMQRLLTGQVRVKV